MEGSRGRVAAVGKRRFSVTKEKVASLRLGHATSTSSMLNICLCYKERKDAASESGHKQERERPGREGYLGIDVSVRAVPADVDLVLRGFLVHGVIEVDGVGVLQAPVSPHQHGSERHQGHDHCGRRRAQVSFNENWGGGRKQERLDKIWE